VSKKLFSITFIIFLTLVACSKEIIENSPLNDEVIKKLQGAKVIEDIFHKSDQIKLSLTPESSFGYITDLEVDSLGNFLIADGWLTRQVYIFSAQGQFLQILGKKGFGPGEYLTPVSIEIDKAGQIWIADYNNNKVNVYDSDYKFIKAITFKPRIKYYLHLNSKGWIYLYLGQLSMGNKTIDLIYLYNNQGQLIKSFAPLLQEVKDINFSVVQDGMVIDRDDFIYEMSPIYYKIRKYDAEGTLIKSFPPEPIDFRLDRKKPLILNGPFYLEAGLILAQIKQRIDFYDTEGNFLVGLPLESKIIAAKGNTLYVLKEGTEEEILVSNPTIIGYKLKI